MTKMPYLQDTKGAKTASPIRRGFELQDLVALQLALEAYIQRVDFSLYLEFKGGKGLDDVVVVTDDSAHGYQVKHAQNRFDNYVKEDFTTSTDKRVQFKKFAEGWQELKGKYSPRQVTCHLVSNRSIEKSSADKMISSDGRFDDMFIENRRRGTVKDFRSTLISESSLDDAEFRQFLGAFRFNLNYRSISELGAYITDTLLSKSLGITDEAVFLNLLRIIKYHAEDTHDPITHSTLDEVFEKARKVDLQLPQVFPIDESMVVRRKGFSKSLDFMLSDADGEYVVVTGVPGSGKSTSLTTYLDDLGKNSPLHVVKYYCFVGITDNQQKLRLEANALRANILAQLQRQFAGELDRRFDYGERNFLEALETIGQHLKDKSKKLVVFVDGLDHAERFDGLLQSVQEALPQTIPENVVFLIGTQELKIWQPLTLKKGREYKHVDMPLLQFKEVESFFKNREIDIADSNMKSIYERSGGHPLYLVYIAQCLSEGGVDVANLPVLKNSMITDYYEVLWNRFERDGVHKARHLSGVLSALRFPIHIDEVINFQNQIQVTEFSNCLREVKHLLRFNGSHTSIFHDSFRLFVTSKLDPVQKRSINQGICNCLKEAEGSKRWFEHVIQYAVNADDADYVFERTNREFVDLAMEKLVPGESILYSLELAMRLAVEKENWREIARLGVLRSRSRDRFEFNLEHEVLAEALLHLDNAEQIVGYIRSHESGRWLVEGSTAIAIAKLCIRSGYGKVGKAIYHDLLADHMLKKLGKVELGDYAFCLGFCSDETQKHLRWLGKNKFNADSYMDRDSFAPAFAPDLQSYLEGVIIGGDLARIDHIENADGILEHHVRRFYVIRTLAAAGMMDSLPERLETYVDKHPENTNLELAFYAGLCGLAPETVTKLTEPMPTIKTDGEISEFRHKCVHEFMKCFYLGAIMTAEGKPEAIGVLNDELKKQESFWNDGKRFMLAIGQALISKSSEGINDALGILAELDRREGERVYEALPGLRACLPRVFRYVVRLFAKQWPGELMTLVNRIKDLRQSYLWTTHYGINESIEDYIFELRVWDAVTDVTPIRSHLSDLLKDCASTYSESVHIKGGSRCSHFLFLAVIAAKCGFRDIAQDWISQAIRATNVYGSRKDMTLLNLGSVLEVANAYNSGQALERIGRLFELVKWLSHVTDGKSTKWIPQEIFGILLSQDKLAAIHLLTKNRYSFARWQVIDCVEKYVTSAADGDENSLWALCETITPNFGEAGRHPKMAIRARRNVVEIAVKNGCDRSYWEEKIHNWILTSITSLRWPDYVWQKIEDSRDKREWIDPHSRPGDAGSEIKYMLDGQELTADEITDKCKGSFAEFVAAMERMKSENDGGYLGGVPENVLSYYASNIASLEDARSIFDYVSKMSRMEFSSKVLYDLATAFQRFGKTDEACDCWGFAYKSHYEGEDGEADLKEISKYSRDSVKKVVLDRVVADLDKGWGGSSVALEVVHCLRIIGKPGPIQYIVEDYFQHCEELLDHVPDRKSFEWLEDFNSKEEMEEDLILDFLMAELDTDEVSLGYKLTKSIIDLTGKQPAVFARILSEFNKDDNPWRKMRLLWIVRAAAHQNPELIRDSWGPLWDGQESWNFDTTRTMAETMAVAFGDNEMPAKLSQNLDRIERNQSGLVYSSSYRLTSRSPSPEFLNVYKRGVLFSLQNMIEATSQVLKIPLQSILAEIEEKLTTADWNANDAEKKNKDDWDYRVHPQGWPVLWIFPTMHMHVRDQFYSVLNETLNKLKFEPWRLVLAKRVTQEIDPEYLVNSILPRPSSISPLVVDNEEEWLSDSKDSGLSYLTVDTDQEWLTVYQSQEQKLDTPYEVPFGQQFFLRTILIEPGELAAGEPDEDDYQQRVGYHPEERFTWQQFKNWLLNPPKTTSKVLIAAKELIAAKVSPLGFYGYGTLASLSSTIINDFGLSFREHDLYEGDEQVTKLEMWQEGYVDDDYSDDKLAQGTRLQVKAGLLHRISLRYGLSLYQSKKEIRAKIRSRYDQKLESQVCLKSSFLFNFNNFTE